MSIRHCEYKDVLGAPGTGFHEKRMFGLAAGDVVGTLIIALVLARFVKMNPIIVFVLLLVFGEVLHWLFCVDTAGLKMLNDLLTR